MTRFAMLLGLLVLCACRPDESSLVLPGPWSQQTTVVDLEKRFGKSNVRITEAREVLLFPDDPKRRATVSFYDSQALEGVHSISVQDAGSKWRGKHGVHVGMSFAELRKINGKPFIIYGFDVSHRGRVHDGWSPALDDDDGALGALDVGEGDRMYFNVELGLRAGAKLPANALPVDDSVLSDDPRYPQMEKLLVVTGFSATTSLDDEWD